jgi:hypothetical protein
MMKMAEISCLLREESAAGSEAGQHWSCEPVLKSGPDVDTYPELLPPMVGEHVEQIVLPLDISRQPTSVEEVRHGHDLF